MRLRRVKLPVTAWPGLVERWLRTIGMVSEPLFRLYGPENSSSTNPVRCPISRNEIGSGVSARSQLLRTGQALDERIGPIWSDRINLRNPWVCCCRWFRRFSRTVPAAVGAVFSDDDQPDIRGPKPHNQECIPLLTEVVENSSQYNDCSPADLRSPSTLANADGVHDHLGSLLAAFVISEY